MSSRAFLSHLRAPLFLRPLNPRPLILPESNMTMSTSGSTSRPAVAASSTKTKAKKDHGKKEVKILMLHGYTQSGPLFRSKTRAMEKLIAKSLAPFNLLPVLFYPTAPIKLSPNDIPGYAPAEGGGAMGEELDYEPEAYAWFRKDEASGTYRHLREGMEALSEAVAEAAAGAEGGVDGVIGFSQGGAVAGMLASALEAGTRPSGPSSDIPEEHVGWVEKLRRANGGKELKFSVVYSGFWSPPEDLQWMYEPKVRTPTMHFLGSLDSVVTEERSRALVDRCVEPVVVTHPGGHYVPVGREWVMPLVGFLRDRMVEREEEKEDEEAEFAALG